MWRLTKIFAQNLCAFKELDYTLNQDHTTLVFGNNMDNDSQVSNGSGKSALIEAIAIGLTGGTLRDIKMEEVINDQEDFARVNLTLLNDATGIVMEIKREISRKNPQSIKVEFTKNGETKKEVQPSVNDYNKFILETIGLSRDDIFANYILSKHKYTSFLSSSDREKKEIINRFSNGIIVDESIAALQADMEPIKDDLQAAERDVATCKGRVSAIDEQIANAVNESTERSQNKAKRIEEWKESIVNKRSYIREQNASSDEYNKALDVLEEVANKLEELEGGDAGFESDYETIVKLFSDNKIEAIKDYKQTIESLRSQLQEKSKELSQIEKEVEAGNKSVEDATSEYEQLKKEYESFESSFQEKYGEVSQKIQTLLNSVKSLEQENDKLNARSRSISSNIGTIQTQLAGVIVCPKCKHEFTLKADENVADLRKQLTELEHEQSEVKSKVSENNESISEITENGRKVRKQQNDMDAERSSWSQKVTNAQSKVDECSRSVSRKSRMLDTLNDEISSINKKIASLRTSMFDEACNIVEELMKKYDNQIKQCLTNIETANGAIASYEESIKELENASDTEVIDNLKASKKKYEKELEEAISEQETKQQELAKYQQQEATFIEFKTHLANTKIEALSHITNEFLEAIGSDIRIVFSGYTVLKSGKIRDKISISLIRDGIDGGSFNKYSEGEKSRVNLANILAMHKLTNVNCTDDKGLDLLVLDEILDACDEEGLSNMFQALNHLKITSLVVSHGNIAENYPYKLIVNKQNGISFI